MDSGSFQFVLFGLVAAILSNLSRSAAWRSAVLAVSSASFLLLLARHPIGLLPLLGFLLLGYVLLTLRLRGWLGSLAAGIVLIVSVYIWLKKYTWLPESSFLHFPYFTLGLSYIFFRLLHLLIEAGSEKGPIGPAAYLLYLLNFTTLISGPIQRYNDFARDQFADQPISLGAKVIGAQLERIVWGLFKVNVLAMLLNLVQLNALAEIGRPIHFSLKFYAGFRLAVAYPFFLYTNFSGYIDIVIALARLMRVRLPENFDRPFSASSFIEFWSRWHITLSTWLKTYVYNPLLISLMRRNSSLTLQPLLNVFSVFVTFFLVGVWHGRTSEFLNFGVLQGGGIAVNTLWQLGLARGLGRKNYQSLAHHPAYVSLARGLTFSWFAFTLFWLWADWKQINEIFASMRLAQWLAVWLAIWLSTAVAFAFWEWLRTALFSIKSGKESLLMNRYTRVAVATAMGLIAFLTAVLLNQPAPDIVYKAF